MKTNNTEKGLVIARIVAVTLLALYFGIMVYGWVTGNELPDAARRFLGIIDLIALPAAVFTTIRLRLIRSHKNG